MLRNKFLPAAPSHMRSGKQNVCREMNTIKPNSILSLALSNKHLVHIYMCVYFCIILFIYLISRLCPGKTPAFKFFFLISQHLGN